MNLGSRTFTISDQEAFAELSGDGNPMHMDGVAARRTQMGAMVVHGIHGVLWALDLACGSAPLDVRAIKVNFALPIYVGDLATVLVASRSDQRVRLQVVVDRTTCTTITIELGQREAASAKPPAQPVMPSSWPEQPRALDFADLAAEGGAFAPVGREAQVSSAFPGLVGAIGVQRVTALAALSRLVGMICPGLHSIFSGLSVDLLEQDPETAIRYRVVQADDRFRLARLAVSGPGLAGELMAFARLPPVAQPGIAEIAMGIPQGAYRSAVVLVIGGSRGLGEIAAKACAAGGAHVIATYAVGREEADRVANEIRDFGGICDVMQLDVRRRLAEQLIGLPARPTHLYYFATGPIALRRTRLLDPDVLAEFMRFYATAFVEACEALAGPENDMPLRAFYPSSVAVEDTPKGWVEYAMAKAAGELLCREMSLQMPRVDIVMRRLPRLLTDQTATVRSAASASVLDTILPIVAEMQQR